MITDLDYLPDKIEETLGNMKIITRYIKHHSKKWFIKAVTIDDDIIESREFIKIDDSKWMEINPTQPEFVYRERISK